MKHKISDFAEAMKDAQNALDIDESNLTGLMYMAQALLGAGQRLFPQALATLDKALDTDPDNAIVSAEIKRISKMQRVFQSRVTKSILAAKKGELEIPGSDDSEDSINYEDVKPAWLEKKLEREKEKQKKRKKKIKKRKFFSRHR